MPQDMADRYLDLLEKCLTREIFLDERPRDLVGRSWHKPIFAPILKQLQRRGIFVGRFEPGDVEALRLGREWPPPRFGDTLVGSMRLRNLRELLTVVVREDIPGDAFEAGVWRGGAAIYMRAILETLADTTRR